MSEAVRYDLPELAAMDRLGARIAERLRPGDVVALAGDLGAGKTTLARAVIKALGHSGEVPSPSFTILEIYEPPAVRLPVVHADFYRLGSPLEAVELGVDDYLDQSALIAEWPERGGFDALLATTLLIRLETAERGRIAIARGGSDWLGRMP